MTQKEFIFQLRLQLAGLPTAEVDDIIRDQEEFIRDACAAGRTEESVVAALGTPADLARNLKAEIKIENAEEKIFKATEEKHLSEQMKGVFGAVGAVLVLAPFNLIFVLGPFTALMGVLFGGWVTAVTLALVAIVLIIVFFGYLVFVPGGGVLYIAMLFGFLALLAAGCFMLGLMYMVTQFVVKMILRYLRWNISFIKKNLE